MVVVEHQDRVGLRCRQLVQEGRQRHLDGRWLGVSQERERVLTDVRQRSAQRCHHVPPEPGRVVVRGVQGEPRGDRAARHPMRVAADANQSTSNVDFPKPAGAETSISFAPRPRSRRCRSRGRGTSPGRGDGRKSFVSMSGWDIPGSSCERLTRRWRAPRRGWLTSPIFLRTPSHTKSPVQTGLSHPHGAPTVEPRPRCHPGPARCRGERHETAPSPERDGRCLRRWVRGS